MRSTNEQPICLWPDYDWCLAGDQHMYNWKSDDYLEVSLEFDDEPTIEQLREAFTPNQ